MTGPRITVHAHDSLCEHWPTGCACELRARLADAEWRLQNIAALAQAPIKPRARGLNPSLSVGDGKPRC